MLVTCKSYFLLLSFSSSLCSFFRRHPCSNFIELSDTLASYKSQSHNYCRQKKNCRMEDKEEFDESEIEYTSYAGEHHLPLIMSLVDQELSEPYSIFTYRYFVYLWPQLCFLAFHKGRCVGTVVCKMGEHRQTYRGYIAMLVVIKPYRGRGLATELVTRSIKVMMESGCEEVTLEAEVSNKGALALYGRLGFIRAKRLYHYYLNGMDAFRLKLLFPTPRVPQMVSQDQMQQEQEILTG